jgi:hypothetical protein
MDVITRYYTKRIKNFNMTINTFCKEKGIPSSLNNALTYKANMGIGCFWKNLYVAPKIYLANSKSFLAYRESLDIDFQNDIITNDEIFALQQETIKNKHIKEQLKKVMKYDFIEE